MVEETTRDIGMFERAAGREPVQIIAARHGWRALDLSEIWEFRGLIWLFVRRDLKVRYKQTFFGLLWVLLQPLGMTVVYTIFFGYIARIPSDGVPYPVFLLGGMILWQSFSRAVSDGGTSLVSQQALLTKIYFSRPIVPLAPVLSAFVDFGVLVLLLLGLMLFYGKPPSALILLAPFFALLAATLAYAIALWLSALDARYRDVRYMMGFALQMWYFATPIVYPLSVVPERLRFIFLLNPMTAPILGFRWAMLGDVVPPDPATIVASVATTALLLLGGVFFFRRVERNIVDRI